LTAGSVSFLEMQNGQAMENDDLPVCELNGELGLTYRLSISISGSKDQKEEIDEIQIKR
jgi:hypothetical protein